MLTNSLADALWALAHEHNLEVGIGLAGETAQELEHIGYAIDRKGRYNN
jgi:hypothetical protein